MSTSGMATSSRPEGEVEAGHAVSVRPVAALDAFEVDVAPPVAFASMPAFRTDLRSIVGIYLIPDIGSSSTTFKDPDSSPRLKT